MRRFLSITVGAIVILVMALGLVGLDTAAASPDGVSPDQGGRNESPCSPVYKKTANPNVVLLGEVVDLELNFAAVCAGESFPLHIVLVLDASGSMAGGPTADMKGAATDMIRRMRMDENQSIRVGVVEFNTRANTLCQLTNQPGRVIGCINRVSANGGTRIDLGIEEGLKVLLRGRTNVVDRDSIQEVMVVLSDGGNNAGCPPVLQAANGAKSQNVLVITVCVGGCDEQCMRQAATSPRYYFRAENSGSLAQIFLRIAEQVVQVFLKRVTIEDVLPANMQYIEDSAEPPATWDASDRTLKWTTSLVTTDGFTVSFKVKPLDVGYWPTNVEARGQFLDNQNRSGERIYEVPYVTVLQPRTQPTPESPPPPPTETPIPPTPTPTNTPTNTPTPGPEPIYLPISLKQECPIHEEHSDIVLVLDMSTSMTRPTVAGRPKVDAVLEAAKAFAHTVDLEPNEFDEHSQIGVVGFNHDAWVEVPLSTDLPAIINGLNDLPDGMREHTRIDLAVKVGAETALDPAHHKQENTPVVILLTDGLPNQVPYAEDGTVETTILRLSDAAKAQDVVFYTIGVGIPDSPDINERINPELLTDIASSSDHYYETPDAEDVGAIYADLKLVKKCEVDRW